MIRPKVLQLILALTCLLAFPVSGSAADDKCSSKQGWQASAYGKNAHLSYVEQHRGSPSTPARFEYWENDHLVWHAEATRSCTQGVSRCYLILPYEVDGKPGFEIKSQINYVQSSSGEDMIVFSHLSEMITYTYLKEMPSRDIKLVGQSYLGHAYPRKEAMVLPSTFHAVSCKRGRT